MNITAKLFIDSRFLGRGATRMTAPAVKIYLVGYDLQAKTADWSADQSKALVLATKVAQYVIQVCGLDGVLISEAQ